MRHGTYTGPIKHLIGKTAAIAPESKTMIRAQFDDVNLRLSGLPMPDVPVKPEQLPLDALGFTWHSFPAEHFDIREVEPDASV